MDPEKDKNGLALKICFSCNKNSNEVDFHMSKIGKPQYYSKRCIKCQDLYRIGLKTTKDIETSEVFWIGILPTIPLSVAMDALSKQNVEVLSIYPSGPDSDLDYVQVRARENTLKELANVLQFWQRKDRFPFILANSVHKII